jgi:putative flippase GtrA
MALKEASLLQHKGLRQFVKFCIVGASSTVIDKGILALLTMKLMVLDSLPWVPWWTWNTLTFCVAVTNGFLWNRHWTFRGQSAASAKEQYTKFFAINAVGLVLTLCITKVFLYLLTGKMIHPENPDSNHLMIASICPIPFVAIWNFSAAKYWTFRPPAIAADFTGASSEELS